MRLLLVVLGLAGALLAVPTGHAQSPSFNSHLSTSNLSLTVDTTNQPHVLFFDDFVPISTNDPVRVPLADVRTILFVADTTNTKPGASGRLWIGAPSIQEP